VVWVKGLKPSKSVLEELQLERGKPIVVVRPEESYAAYLLQEKYSKRSITENVIRNLSRARGEIQIVIVGRYSQEQIRRCEGFGKQVKVAGSVIDGPSLVAQSSLFIGAGGTMTAEAALLGVPTISIYPGEPTFVEKYLTKVGLVYKSLDPRRAVDASTKMMSDVHFQKRYRRSSKRFLKSMEDPIAVIYKSLTKLEV